MPPSRSPSRRARSASRSTPRSASRTRTPASATPVPKSHQRRAAVSRSPAQTRPARGAVKPAASASTTASSHDATVTTHFEFFGPYIGPLGILVGLPLLVWASAFYCNQAGWPAIPMRLPTMRELSDSFSLHVFLVYVAWWSFQAFLHVVVPGPTAEGVLLRDGSRLKYRINGESLRQSVAFGTLTCQTPPR
jgi:hypothetical protein